MNLMKSGLEKELGGGVSRTPRGWNKVEIIPSVYLSFCLLVTTKVMTAFQGDGKTDPSNESL